METNRRGNRFAQPDRAGFTLVELLVAAAVTVVLAGLMVAIVTRVSATWARSAGDVAAENQARYVLDCLERDLRSVCALGNGPVWLAATVQPDQVGAGDVGGSGLANWTAPGAPKPRAQTPDPAENSLVLTPASGRIEDCRFGMAGVWLRLITQVADDNRDTSHTSSPRAVAYQLVRHNLSNTGGATVRYSLFRSEVRAMGSRSTFAVGYDLFAAEYNDAAAGGTSLADAGTLRRPRRDQLLANNVIDFGVRFYARDVSSALICLFPRDSGNLGFAASVRDGRTSLAPAWGGNPALPPAGSSSHAYAPGEMSYGYPVVAEVAVRILSEDGAREIAALERGDLTGRGWWATALPMSRVFTRRIEIGAAPL